MSKLKKLIPKNELHHWWPRSLSNYWGDADGRAHSLAIDGKVVRSKPQQFGAVRNDNNIYLADEPSVWDESFEHSFGPPDSAIPTIVDWLKTASSPIAPSDAEFAKRITPLVVTDQQFVSLTSILASLIIRSPSFRHRVDSGTRALRARMGLPLGSGDRGLLGMNIRHGQDTLSKAMSRGKFAVLLSGDREFIFGDGFMHNVHQVNNAPHRTSCLVPLTPEIAIFYTSPMSYRSYPRAFVMNLSGEEIDFVNRSVQAYACRFLFYRSQKPPIGEDFTRGEFLQFHYDRVPWTEMLEQAICETFFGDDSLFYPPSAPLAG